MTNKIAGRFISILLIVALLFCGCRDSGNANGDGNGENTQPEGGVLAVYAHERYRTALQQIFSSTKMAKESFSVHWVSDMESADVVITNHIPESRFDTYRVLQPETLAVRSVAQLQLQDDRGVIGIPLFLRIEGFWYDAQFYGNDSTVPLSLDSWEDGQFPPAIYDSTDVRALFWGIVAPVYLNVGGTAEQLSVGQFEKNAMLLAMQRLETISRAGLIQPSEDGRQAFTTAQTPFWITGDQDVAAAYNYKTTLSAWNFSASLPFYGGEQAGCVVRADVVAVKSSADEAVANRFVTLLFDQNTLEDLSADTQKPIACRLQYSTGVVPEVAQICYTALSSPSVELSYVHCQWESDRMEQIYQITRNVLSGDLTATEAVEQITVS